MIATRTMPAPQLVPVFGVRKPKAAVTRPKINKEEFYSSVFRVVRLIPPQRITSYSHIAALIGMPKHARLVREALNFIVQTSQPAPWHRVTSAAGILSSRIPVGGANNTRTQRELLELEGIAVEEGVVGELRVDFTRWGWFPNAESLASLEQEVLNRFSSPTLEEERDWGA